MCAVCNGTATVIAVDSEGNGLLHLCEDDALLAEDMGYEIIDAE